MRKTIVILIIAIAAASTFTSCATAYGSGNRSGCKMSQGYVGYR